MLRSRRLLLVAWAAWMFTAVACQPRARPPVSLFEEDDPGARSEVGATQSRPQTPAAGRAQVAGQVDRSDLLQVLDQGVGSFLAGVDVEPYFRDERFAGWEILRFWPDHPQYAVVDLRRGDVVTQVNGRDIKRPNQLAELWDELRGANTIEITGFRNGAPFLLQLQVVGDPS